MGYDRGDLAAGRMRWTDLTPAEWRERDERARAELSSTGTVQSYEKEYFRKDGGRVPVLIGGALFEQSGSEGVAFVLDLTERNRAEGALRESEYKLRKIIETVPSLLWSTDPAGEPTQLSQRMLDYSGMQFEDFLHGGWEAFIHPDDFPETARAFYHAIQTGISYQAVNRLRRADGEFRWHQTRGEPLRDRERQIVQWYGLSVDIDERKKAEERLRRSESYLAEAQRLSHTGTWVLDARGLIRCRALQAAKICGNAFTQTIETGCGKKSRRHCARKEISRPSSESYYLMEQSNTSKQPPIMSFPRPARWLRRSAHRSM